MNYQTVQDTEQETIIRKSRFIAIVKRVSSEEEMFNALTQIRRAHGLATHVCYGAVIDERGNVARFSDDGEPSGTAGAPILETIKNAKLRQTLVAVVRYFGGIKLGAGGLTRAYSSVANEALKSATKIMMVETDFYEIEMDFSKAKRVSGIMERRGIRIKKTEYASNVKMLIAVDVGVNIESIMSEILGAKPSLVFVKTDYDQV